MITISVKRKLYVVVFVAIILLVFTCQFPTAVTGAGPQQPSKEEATRNLEVTRDFDLRSSRPRRPADINLEQKKRSLVVGRFLAQGLDSEMG